MSITKQIISLIKQNDGISSSLEAKNIDFNDFVLNTELPEEEQLNNLKTHNIYLKELSKQTRQPQEKKIKVVQEQPKKLIKEEKKDDEESDDEIKEEKFNYSTICNMEDIKRAFFANDYDQFKTLIKEQKLIFYTCDYKLSTEFDDKPDYMARNLLRGFVQNLDDFRKYFMVCFRCIELKSQKYSYPSFWIVNTNDDLKTILGSIYSDNIFTIVSNDNIDDFLKNFEKKTDENIIGELYLH